MGQADSRVRVSLIVHVNYYGYDEELMEEYNWNRSCQNKM